MKIFDKKLENDGNDRFNHFYMSINLFYANINSFLTSLTSTLDPILILDQSFILVSSVTLFKNTWY